MRTFRVLAALAALSVAAPARVGGAASTPDPESKALQELRSGNPAAADSFQRGRIARESGDHPRAAALFHDVRVAAPGFSHAWRAEGYELIALGRRPDAIACMRTAVGLERSAGNLLGLASVLSRGTEGEQSTDNEIAESVALLQEAETREESAELARLGCRLAIHTQNTEWLRIESERYVRLAPSDPWAHYVRAIYSTIVGDAGSARRHAKLAGDLGLPEGSVRYLDSMLESLPAPTDSEAPSGGQWLRWAVISAFLAFLGVGVLLRVPRRVGKPKRSKGSGPPTAGRLGTTAGRPEPTVPGASQPARPSMAADGTRSLWAIPILAGLTVVLLLPFIGKAFHIDDPLFVWAAKQIESKPLDPYGFEVNWYGAPMAMSDVTKNPPLTSYFIAGVAKVVGLSERAVHVAFLAQAVVVILGTYWLARKLCGRPRLAALSTLFTPVFLVSSSTVMSDTLMLAFWMTAVAAWVSGLERGSWIRLLLASLCVALAALSKYFAIALIPLLVVYAIATRRRITGELTFLLVPVVILAAYHLATRQMYGRGLLSDAASYAGRLQEMMAGWLPARFLIGTCFTGGCVGLVWLLAFLPWRRSSVPLALGAVLFGAAAVFGVGRLLAQPIVELGGSSWIVTPGFGLFAAAGLFAAGGAVVLFLGGRALLLERDPGSLLLSLWALGTFGFTVLVNWTINARSILPMVPAVAILLARRMEAGASPAPRWRLIPILAAAALLALIVTQGDFLHANSARSAADEIDRRFGGRPGLHWFRGHWGFQYYMEAKGWSPIRNDFRGLQLGDLVAFPSYNTNGFRMPTDMTQPIDTLEVPVGGWAATMRVDMGAGFYAGIGAPLPFALGKVPPEPYRVGEVVVPTGR